MTNPVAPYAVLNNTAVTGSVYKNDIDNNSVAALRIVGRFAPHAQATPNMTIMLDAGSLFDGTTLTEVAAQSTSTLTAPTLHPRIDRVVIDNITGILSVAPGTEAVSPVPVAIPAGKSPVAQVLLQTATTAITNAIITDERNFSALAPGGFGAQGSVSSATTCNIGSVLSQNTAITGTTTIASFGSAASLTSPIYLVKFAAALTLTNSASLVCLGGADILTAAGDTAVLEYVGTGNWRIRSYARATGKTLVASAPTYSYLTSSGTYTTPAGCTQLSGRMVGGGAGGGGYGTGTNGSAGGDTTFNGVTAAGGSPGGAGGGGTFGAGGTGGAGTAAYRQHGGTGQGMFYFGSLGGTSRLGPGASGGPSVTGSTANANTGGGGGGGGSSTTTSLGAGPGGAGEYAEFAITNPASTYSYTIGTGGAAGTGNNPGGAGGSGLIMITEFYA